MLYAKVRAWREFFLAAARDIKEIAALQSAANPLVGDPESEIDPQSTLVRKAALKLIESAPAEALASSPMDIRALSSWLVPSDVAALEVALDQRGVRKAVDRFRRWDGPLTRKMGAPFREIAACTLSWFQVAGKR